MLKQIRKEPKPFLKWAGGKGQLISEIEKRLPRNIKISKKIESYFEPFVGGGAVFFWLSCHYKIRKSHLYDVNPEIVTAFKTVQKKVNHLIDELEGLQREYHKLNERERENFYYSRREKYNSFIKGHEKNNVVRRSALIIFLNKTCFNGLFRVNSQGLFNVPFGRYANPTICDKENLIAVSSALKTTEIDCQDFAYCLKKADGNSLVYFDPPYRPISKTSNFTGYIKNGFSDKDQKRLKEVCDRLREKGTKTIVSNSDPANTNPRDKFFDKLYRPGYRIERVPAVRMINCDAARRGRIKELLVM